jgi:cell shape-determining protein MreC
MAVQQIQGQDMTELEKENQRLRELIEQLKADLKTALQAYRDVVSKM